MRAVTLVYCLRNDTVLLGFKKRGFGVGKLNGYGGKVHDDETIAEAAVRELREEAAIDAKPSDLEKVAEIDFYFADVPKEKGWDQTVHVYLLKNWRGEPQETEEMRPAWYSRDALPLDQMWVDDPYWLTKALDGEKFRAAFTFGKQGATVIDHTIEYVSGL